MSRLAHRLGTLAIAVALTSCVNTTDEGMIAAAETLVPPESIVTDVTENIGTEALVGSYRVHLTMSDGGVGEDLDEAIARQAESAGWTATYRREAVGGVELGFTRNGLQADVDVYTENDPITAVVRVERSDS